MRFQAFSAMQIRKRCIKFPYVKRLGLEFDLSSPSGAEVKNEWSYTSLFRITLYDLDREFGAALP
jgi:hypothetical protein